MCIFHYTHTSLSKQSPINPICNISLHLSVISLSFGKFNALQSIHYIRGPRLDLFRGSTSSPSLVCYSSTTGWPCYLCVIFGPTCGSTGVGRRRCDSGRWSPVTWSMLSHHIAHRVVFHRGWAVYRSLDDLLETVGVP